MEVVPPEPNALQQNQDVHDGAVFDAGRPIVNEESPRRSLAPPFEQYITMFEMEKILACERSCNSMPTMPDLDLMPPYPIELTGQPYAVRYVASLKFPLFNGRKGNAREYIVRFLDSLGAYRCDESL